MTKTNVQEALTFIGKNYLGQIDTLAVASHLNCDYYQLHRDFFKHTQMTVRQYIEFRRLRHAKWMMVATDKHLKEIWNASGFKAASQFTRAFRRVFKQTAGEYRRQYTCSAAA
jgi:transcriptional regulator GlxA family with amidase domain